MRRKDTGTESIDGPSEWSPKTGWPSPEEIAERSAEIRAKWSEDERRRRRVGPAFDAETPTIAVADVTAAL
jgi:hypothetical protein